MEGGDLFHTYIFEDIMGGYLFELLILSLSVAFFEDPRASIGMCSLLDGCSSFKFLVRGGGV